jgi:hypothetical protein
VTSLYEPDLSAPTAARAGRAAPATRATGRNSRWLWAAGAAGTCVAGLGFIYAVDPNQAGNPYPPCLLKRLTGIDCPGCGGTRAVYSLLHGDVVGAVDHNILALVVVPVLLYLTLRFVLRRFEISMPVPRMKPWMAWATAAFLLAFSVARNIEGPLHYFNSALA